MELDLELVAHEAADRLWPVGGDPAYPNGREQSHGWNRARLGFLAGFKARKEGKPMPFENPSPDVWDHGFRAGWEYIDPPYVRPSREW